MEHNIQLLLFALLVLCSSQLVQGETSPRVMNYERSDLLFQALEHQFVLSLNPNFSYLIFVASGFTESISSQIIGIGIEYGFTKKFSLSLGDDYGSAVTKIGNFESTARGTSNIVVTGKGSFDLDQGRQLFALFALSISPGNTNSTNRYYGGNIYTPQIAYQQKLDEISTLVFKFDTTYYGPATYDGDVKTTGTFSSSISTNYETKINLNKLGSQFALTHYYTGADFANYIALSTYMNFFVRNNFSLMPNLGYTVPIDALSKKAGVKEDDLFSLQLNTRYAF